VVRAITRLQGYRIVGGATDTFVTRLAALELPVSVSESLVPLRSVMALLNQELANADQRFAALVAEDPIVKRTPARVDVRCNSLNSRLDVLGQEDSRIFGCKTPLRLPRRWNRSLQIRSRTWIPADVRPSRGSP